MKKLPLFLLIMGMLGILALSIPPQKTAATSTTTSPELLGSIHMDITAAPQPDQEEKFAMKPAWYRYFNLHPTETKPSSTQALRFRFVNTPQKPDFITFKLINITTEELSIRVQNGSLIMIQEAKNKQGEWQPIEYWDYDWGMGSIFEELVLEPKYAVKVSAPRYSGEFTTQIRFKLKIGNAADNSDVIYSRPIEGSVSLSQFNIHPKAEDKTISYLEEKL